MSGNDRCTLTYCGRKTVLTLGSTFDGTIPMSKYLTDSTCVANGFGALLTLTGGEYSYVSETYFIHISLNLPGFDTGVYVRNFF
jgi:hypothetical protein